MAYVYVRELSTGIILYSRQITPTEKRDHDKFARMVAKQHNCKWQPNERGNILVEFRPLKIIDWAIYNGRRYDFAQGSFSRWIR